MGGGIYATKRSMKNLILSSGAVLLLLMSPNVARGQAIGQSKSKAVSSPMKFIEYKNSHYLQPPVGAGDHGHMIRIPLTVPGAVKSARLTGGQGKGCGWTHECPDGAACPEPYRHPFDISGNTATWNGWSNSGENCVLYFDVEY